MKVLITGATGFIGMTLVENLVKASYDVVALVREPSLILPKDVVQVVSGDMTDWSVMNPSSKTKMKQALLNIDVVIHLAARVHVMADSSNDPLTEFRALNRDATLALARVAAQAGVKRFIFLSSIGVNGNNNSEPFTEQDKVCPYQFYAFSKLEAEQELLTLAASSKMDVTIIRPPLVYGPKAPGNFSTLMYWMNKNVPLPFGAIHNQRSLIALDNLVNFIILCIDHPKAANETFLISDDEDVSTTQLLQKVASALGNKTRLIPVPVGLMTLAAKLVGKKAVAERLFGSLRVDSSKARELLDWQPVITMDEQLKKTVKTYLENEKTL